MILVSSRSASVRRGTTLVESLLVFMVFLTLVLGMFDFGMAVMHMHLLSDAARQVARQARVHGGLADVQGPWGPATVGPLTAGGSHPACATLRDALPGFDPETVTMQVEWLDGDNAEGMRVRVSLGASHTMILPQMWGGGTLTLRAASTTPISH